MNGNHFATLSSINTFSQLAFGCIMIINDTDLCEDTSVPNDLTRLDQTEF